MAAHVRGFEPAMDASGLELAGAVRAGLDRAARRRASCDAVVIGAGASGAMAALMLTEAGLRVTILDAGRAVARGSSVWGKGIDRLKSAPLSASTLRRFYRWRQPVQSHCYAWAIAPEAFVDDAANPYCTPADRPFTWIRSRQLGGRMAVPGHGRQYYRFSDDDLAAAGGARPAWPISYGELEPWYAAVERRIGMVGTRDEIPWLPDSELEHVLAPAPHEAEIIAAISARWPDARAVLGRHAPPANLLRAAAQTGRLQVLPGAVVREIEVDAKGSTRGVVWLDANSRRVERTAAPLVFLCASALESTRILLLSRSPESPDGIGASSQALGRFLMDHVRIRAEGWSRSMVPDPDHARRCVYLPRFDARNLARPCAGPGFGVQVYQLHDAGTGRAHFVAASFAEMLPRPDNRVTLHPWRRDVWGIPTLHIDCSLSDAEREMAREQAASLRELADALGVVLTRVDEAPPPPGSANHECGTARMGSDPRDSVLDPFNQCWEARGLYVTDGACLPSQGTQNPTLTYLALTARACQHALQAGLGGDGQPAGVTFDASPGGDGMPAGVTSGASPGGDGMPAGVTSDASLAPTPALRPKR